jgi:hypothetical protein
MEETKRNTCFIILLKIGSNFAVVTVIVNMGELKPC